MRGAAVAAVLAVCVSLVVGSAALQTRTKGARARPGDFSPLSQLARLAHHGAVEPPRPADVDDKEGHGEQGATGPLRQSQGVAGFAEAWGRQLLAPVLEADATSVVDGIKTFWKGLLFPELNARARAPIPHPRFTSNMKPPAGSVPSDVSLAAVDARAQGLASGRMLAAHEHLSSNCSGVGTLINSTGVAFDCGGTTVSEAVYDAILAVQEDGSQGAVDALAELLPADLDFGNLIPQDTGIKVNLSQVFSGQLLTDVMKELNITNPNAEIDVGELFNDGVPVLNTTELLELLPLEDVDGVIDDIECDVVPTSDTNCACPLDYVGPNCETPRNWTCTAVVADSTYQQCIAANAATSPQRGYRSKLSGDPPCWFFNRGAAAPEDALEVPVDVQCFFVDRQTPLPRCNGTSVTAAFIEDQAAAQNVSVAALPGSPPFYNFHCAEETFRYAVGDWNSSLALTTAVHPVTVVFRPANFFNLSDATLKSHHPVPAAELPVGSTVRPTLPIGTLPNDFIAGGRVYVEVYVRGGYANGTTAPPLATAFPHFHPQLVTRLVLDREDYKEPKYTAPVNVVLVVFVLLLVAAVVGVAVWFCCFRKVDSDAVPDASAYTKMKAG